MQTACLYCSDFSSQRTFPRWENNFALRASGSKTPRAREKKCFFFSQRQPRQTLTCYRQSARGNWIELETIAFCARGHVNIWCERKISCANSQISKQLCIARAAPPASLGLLYICARGSDKKNVQHSSASFLPAGCEICCCNIYVCVSAPLDLLSAGGWGKMRVLSLTHRQSHENERLSCRKYTSSLIISITTRRTRVGTHFSDSFKLNRADFLGNCSSGRDCYVTQITV